MSEQVWSEHIVIVRLPPEPQTSDELDRVVQVACLWFRRLYESLFIEIHFYFVTWTNCQNMMKTLASFPEYTEASKHYNSVRKHLDHYTEARNTFEHFHERLPAGKNRDRVKEMRAPNAGPRRVFGGLAKGSYTFSDRSWDITPVSLNLLQSIVEEFLGKVHAVVIQRCDAFLEQEQQRVAQ